MSLMAGLIQLVIADAGMNAVIGTRFEPLLMRTEQVRPAGVVQVVGGSSEPTFDGPGLQKLRVQFDFYAATYGEADSAREALRDLLDGYSGTLADGTSIQYAEHLQSLDFPVAETREFRCVSEFYLYFNFQ